MNSELKLRVWDKANNIFHYTDPIVTRVEIQNGNRRTDGKIMALLQIILKNQFATQVDELPINQDNYIIQLGSGCKDKHGKEIYDGDALKYHGRIGFVEFFAGAFRCNWEDQSDDEIGTMVISEMEVVGVKTYESLPTKKTAPTRRLSTVD